MLLDALPAQTNSWKNYSEIVMCDCPFCMSFHKSQNRRSIYKDIVESVCCSKLTLYNVIDAQQRKENGTKKKRVKTAVKTKPKTNNL